MTVLMEDKPRANIKDLIVDPQTFISEIGDDKVRILYMELLMLMEDYERQNVIAYLSSNYSHNKHLSTTALTSMHDEEIIQIMERTKAIVGEEMRRRKEMRAGLH